MRGARGDFARLCRGKTGGRETPFSRRPRPAPGCGCCRRGRQRSPRRSVSGVGWGSGWESGGRRRFGWGSGGPFPSVPGSLSQVRCSAPRRVAPRSGHPARAPRAQGTELALPGAGSRAPARRSRSRAAAGRSPPVSGEKFGELPRRVSGAPGEKLGRWAGGRAEGCAPRGLGRGVRGDGGVSAPRSWAEGDIGGLSVWGRGV